MFKDTPIGRATIDVPIPMRGTIIWDDNGGHSEKCVVQKNKTNSQILGEDFFFLSAYPNVVNFGGEKVSNETIFTSFPQR